MPDGAVASITSSEGSNRSGQCDGDLRRVRGVMNLAEIRLQEGESIELREAPADWKSDICLVSGATCCSHFFPIL
jgi:hypothetical protein